MYDTVFVKVLKGDEEFGLKFAKASLSADMVKVTAINVVHDEVEVLPVLEGVVHVDEEGVSEFSKQFALFHD